MAGIYLQKRKLPKIKLARRKTKVSDVAVELDFSQYQRTKSYRSFGSDTDLLLKETARYQRSRYTSTDDTGHEFETHKSSVTTSHPSVFLVNSSTGTTYRGPLLLNDPQDGYAPRDPVNPPTFNMGFYGPTAISKTSPTKPDQDTLVSAAELLREGLPNLKGISELISRLGSSGLKPDFSSPLLKALDASASGYLSYEFAWKPLINDIVGTLLACLSASKTLTQLMVDSGQVVRREMTFPLVSTISEPSTTSSINMPGISSLASRYRLIDPGSSGFTYGGFPFKQTLTTESVWFKGAYTYYVSKDDSLLGQLKAYEQKAHRLLGLRVTPEVLWNLTGWSWLIDWMANVSDGLSAAGMLANDNLVLKYGYLMRTYTRNRTLTYPQIRTQTGGFLTNVRTNYRTESRMRFRSTPYGFGLDPSVFDARQWAILAALGISRRPS